jgi:uncharacterized protein YoxC
MSAGEVAGLIAACAFVLLVGILAIPLLKLGGVLTEAQRLVADIDRQTVPLLTEVTASVKQVNSELVRVDVITANAQSISGNVSALTSLFAATLGSPVIKVAAFSYGVRKTLGDKQRDELEKQIRTQRRAEKAARKAAKRGGSGPGSVQA